MGTSASTIIDRRSLMKGAAALGAASAVTLGVADRAAATTVTLDPTPGQGPANKAALQAAINATPAGEWLVLPGGSVPYEIDISAGGLSLPKSITIVGDGNTTLNVLPKTATAMNSLFTVPTTVASGHFGFESLTIDGPTTTSGGGSAVEWLRLGSVGTISFFSVTVTGQFQYGIRRSGVGTVHLTASAINARGTCVHLSDNGSGAGSSRLILAGCQLSGFGTRTADYGIQLQSHIALQCGGTQFQNFDVWGIHVSGGAASSTPSWTVTNCRFIDAALANTGSAAHAVFHRVTQNVTSGWIVRQPTLSGPATFLDCVLLGSGGFLLGAAATVKVRFQSCYFKPKGLQLTAGASSGQVVFDSCTWELAAAGQAVYLTSAFTGSVRLRRSTIADCGTTSTNLSLYGGTTTYVGTTIDSPKPSHGISTTSGATKVGSPTLTNTGTCPVTPAY